MSWIGETSVFGSLIVSLAKQKRPSGKHRHLPCIHYGVFHLGNSAEIMASVSFISVQVATPQPTFPKQVLRTISAGLFVVVM